MASAVDDAAGSDDEEMLRALGLGQSSSARAVEAPLVERSARVLAFFFPANGAGRTYATAARDRFLAEYPAVAPASIPLLRYNPAAKQTPFEPAGGT